MTWALIQHVAHEGPGMVARVASRQGLAVRIHRMDLGDSPPRASEIEGLVVMGGPMNVFDDHDHPYLCQERRLLRDCLALRRPVLGICLGAQLLADAAGARVYHGPSIEVGVGAVRRTAAGRNDPLFADVADVFDAFHWHGDTFELPAEAVCLASTDVYEHQAFRVGQAQYGLQFHVELTPRLVAAMGPHLPDGAVPGRVEVERIGRVGRIVLDRFFSLALNSPPSTSGVVY